jgi:eukaryotic-like serine/threonine-protein kinase
MATTGQATRYRVLQPLGRGGMAQVMLAEDTVLGRRVALKRLRVTSDPAGIKRLRREALIGASLNHPNLIPVYDVWEEHDGDLCIVMEYIAGSTLRDLIRDSGSVPASKALPILTGVAAALDAVHQRGIVHRDVKPANILLGVDGQIKLADLGVAAVDDYTKITTADKVVGSFSYMAPEQLEGGQPRPAIDIYALAAVAFETLCGKKARPEPNPVALAHAIATRPPPDLRDCLPDAPAVAAAVLKRGMAADPSERPRSAGELIARLGAAFDEAKTEARLAPAPVVPLSRRAEKQPPPVQLAGEANTYRSRRETPSRMLALGALAALLIAVAAVALIASGSGGGKSGTASSGGKSSARTASLRAARHRRPAHRSGAAATTTSAHGSGATTTTPATSTPATSSAGSSASSSTSSAGAPTTSSAAAAPSATPSTPAGAVETFYEDAARHDYAAAWALADPNLRNQLHGYDSFSAQMSNVRSITFHRAETVSGTGSSPATVALTTTSVQNSGTQNCSGTAQTVRTSSGSWLVDHVSVSCSAG